VTPSEHTYVSATFVAVAILSKSDFEAVAKLYPKVFVGVVKARKLLQVKRSWFAKVEGLDADGTDVTGLVQAPIARQDLETTLRNELK
jgi:hypothetical protein